MNEESKKRLEELRKQWKSMPKTICADCKQEIIHLSPDEEDEVLEDGTILCRNCLYKRIGAYFDEHPYVSPKILKLCRMGNKE